MQTLSLKDKKIVLGIAGGIAAYKSISLVRLLRKCGAEVQVVLTPSAKEFVTPLTLATLSQRPVLSDFFDASNGSWHSHVEMGVWADLMIIAPATASTMAKMAYGVADNLLITTYLSMRAPVCIAPSMDLDMYAHPTTQGNLELLRQRGVTILEPAEGFLASGLHGKGRMMEPEDMLPLIEKELQEGTTSEIWKGKTALITAGPTHENIDDVRFIGNRSSGLMGICMAEELARRGAQVHLILGPTHLLPESKLGLHLHRVTSALDMLHECQEIFPQVDLAIFAAAVADFRPSVCTQGKIKRSKSSEEHPTIALTQNPDIAATMGAQKSPHQLLIGFALETTSDLEEARRKLTAKKMDAIILNSLSDPGAGFGTPTNKITWVEATTTTEYPLASKSQVASYIIDYAEKKIF